MNHPSSSHPEVLAAARCDAAADFDQAINCLARGARHGDLHCKRLLGLRLATGDRAPLLPAQGLGLLAEALDHGDGEAGARGAALLALGANLPAADWQAALQWLTRAAMQGHRSACAQLRALSEDEDQARRAHASQDWPALATSIDLSAWRRAPVPRILSDEPRVSVFQGLASAKLCAFLVSLAPGRLEPARVYDPSSGDDIVVAHRSNTQASFPLQHIEFAQVLLQARMAAACGMPDRNMESPALLHYSPGEQIANHYDFVDPGSVSDYAAEVARNGQRMITFLLYLNEEYAGGETDFPSLGVRYKGCTGDGIYFCNAHADLMPDPRMLHAGRPPVAGEKWIITQFVRSRPMR